MPKPTVALTPPEISWSANSRSRAIRSSLITLALIHKFMDDLVSRRLLEQGKLSDLRARDANLYGALSALPATEREALVRYLQTEVRLQDFERAA